MLRNVCRQIPASLLLIVSLATQPAESSLSVRRARADARWPFCLGDRCRAVAVPAALLLVHTGDAPGRRVAQGFDPGKVDWEALSKIPMKDGFIKQFNDQCAACHGEDLRGTPLGTPLVGRDLRYGASVQEIARSIAAGAPDKGMPAWSETLKESQIWNLALYVAEQRQGTTILDKRADIPLAIPAGRIASERHAFRIEVVAEGLDPMPFSIAPLRDGRILLAERMRGLSIIERDGTPLPAHPRHAAGLRRLHRLPRPGDGPRLDARRGAPSRLPRRTAGSTCTTPTGARTATH